MRFPRSMLISALTAAIAGGGVAFEPMTVAKAANPCAPKAANPCAPKAANPCAPKAANPCAATSAPAVDKALFLRPKGTRLAKGNHAQLVKEGKALAMDTKLGTSGLSCNSCHLNNAAFMPSFAKPYPHQIAMVKERADVKSPVRLDEMVQFCMVVPMAAKPLPWKSRSLAALTAYFGEVQKTFRAPAPEGSSPAKAANPCAAK